MKSRPTPDRQPTAKERMRSLAYLLVAFCLTFACQIQSFGQSQPTLKQDMPKLDTSIPATPPPEKPKGTLKGGVQHSESLGHTRLKRSNGKAQLDRNSLKGQTQNDGLNAQAESGVGIIGVKFVMVVGHAPVINRVFPLTPAARSGVQPNDIIIAVDGIPTTGLAKEEVYDMIVGLPGTPVTLSIQREGEFLSMTMTRMDLNDITDPFVRRDYMTSM